MLYIMQGIYCVHLGAICTVAFVPTEGEFVPLAACVAFRTRKEILKEYYFKMLIGLYISTEIT